MAITTRRLLIWMENGFIYAQEMAQERRSMFIVSHTPLCPCPLVLGISQGLELGGGHRNASPPGVPKPSISLTKVRERAC